MTSLGVILEYIACTELTQETQSHAHITAEVTLL